MAYAHSTPNQIIKIATVTALATRLSQLNASIVEISFDRQRYASTRGQEIHGHVLARRKTSAGVLSEFVTWAWAYDIDSGEASLYWGNYFPIQEGEGARGVAYDLAQKDLDERATRDGELFWQTASVYQILEANQ